MFSNIITDGYTQKGFIVAVPGVHGCLRFTFRPIGSKQNAIFRDKLIKAQKPSEQIQLGNELIVDRLVSWEMVNDSGESVPISIGSIEIVKSQLVDKLFDTILGTRPSDIDPLWSKEEVDAYNDLQGATTEHLSVGILQEAQDKGN